MRKNLFLILIIFVAGNVTAKVASDVCKETYDIAEKVMIYRQAGVPMPIQMKFVDELKGLNSETKQTVRDIVQEAYEEPKYSTQDYQDKSVKEFSNSWYLKCYKATK